MLTGEQHLEVANALLTAYQSRKVIPQVSKTYPGVDLSDAYEIQRQWANAKIAAGARVIGHKIGLTSRAMQVASKMNEPDYGVLLDDMYFSDWASIPFDRFLAPRLETELAFIMGKPLRGPNVTMFDVLNATDYVIPALEVIDYRTEVPRTIYDTVADNAAAAAVIIGGRAVRPMDVDIRWIGATLAKNGVIEVSGVSAAIMGHPALGVAWLVNKIAPHGGSLEPGHLVLGGSFTSPITIAAGDTIAADFGSLGSIGARFV